MLDGELERQRRLKDEIGRDPQMSGWLRDEHLFQNYKQLQFLDTLALYFNRIHPGERGEQFFEHVPLNAQKDTTVTIRPREPGAYTLSPYPFASEGAEFAFAGRRLSPPQQDANGGWHQVLRQAPTEWERFRLVQA